ncbi:MAG: peptide-methionine (S)-S-oxide reductase MsrA [Candidatus Omnitrophota bacterium]
MAIFILLGVLMTQVNAAGNSPLSLKKAVFAGGCFWCLQPGFDHTPGVLSTIVGYTGGSVPNPSYEEVSSGTTGHYEAIEVIYDPTAVAYEKLVDIFWRFIDPTDAQGQFTDRGSQYRTAIFYADEVQKKAAHEAVHRLAVSGKYKKPIVTMILPAATFYPAEDYHQKYYLKQSGRYNAYKVGSGRSDFLKKIADKVIRRAL